MDDLHDETSDLHDEAAHVADELASAMATCEGCGNMGYADSWPFVAPFTAVAGGPAVLLCQDCVQARVDNEIADEMVSEFFGEPADGGGQPAPLSDARLAEIQARLENWQRGYWLAGEKSASLMRNGDERREIAAISAEHSTTIDLLTHAYADEAALLAERERLRAVVDRQAASFVEQRGKLYETMENLTAAQEKARFYATRVDAYMAENIQLKAREAALLAERERLLVVARAMAKGPVSYDGFGCYTCSHCEQEYMECDDPDDDRPGHIEHTVDCPVTQARAALAAADAGERA